MKTIVGLLLIISIAMGCATAKKANEPEPLPAENINIPKTLSQNMDPAPHFCITLNTDFTYIAYLMSIYRTSGERVWTADDPNACWDGKVNTNGTMAFAAEGVYAVIIEIEATNGKRYKTISLLAVLN
jgi:hypothetical protein